MKQDIYITIGASTHFQIKWSGTLFLNEKQHDPQAFLAKRARSLAVPSMPLTRLTYSRTQEPLDFQGRAVKSCHKYSQLGTGSFGDVYKVVDLSNGELWAVKEIAPTGRGGDTSSGAAEKLRATLVREVETMAKISHVSDTSIVHGSERLLLTMPSSLKEHIVHYETYQDFCVEGSFQIFYKLYRGSVFMHIKDKHSCTELQQHPTLIPTMIRQVATALDYLHGKGILHLDIKPDNILFDYPAGDESQPPNFYLGDFGLAMVEAEACGRRVIGTSFYMAPEIGLHLDNFGASKRLTSGRSQ
jgi:serine/threonine protein kinase